MALQTTSKDEGNWAAEKPLPTRHLILFALGLGGSQSWVTHYQLPVGSFVDSTCKVGARLVVGIHIPLRN